MLLMDPEVKRLAHEFWQGCAEEYGRLRQQRFDAMNGCLTDFLDDLLNYPLLRPWRESLDHFQEHYWVQLGLRLTPESYEIIAAIIARAVNDPSCFAYGPIQPDATGVVPGQPAAAVAASEPTEEPVPTLAAEPEIAPSSAPVIKAKAKAAPAKPGPREQFFYDKLAAAQGHLEEMRQLLEVLGQRIDAAKVGEEVDVEADADQIEDLIWRYNDAMESARDAWLRDNLSGDANTRMLEMLTPASLGLPMFTDEEQARRAARQTGQIGDRLRIRDATMDRIVLGMQVAEGAGTAAGWALGAGAVATVFKVGGKWVVLKTLAKTAAATAAVIVADHYAEQALRAAGAGDQTIRGIRLAVAVVSYIILRRARVAGNKAQSPVSQPATPQVRPKGRVLSPADARRKRGIAFNKAREPAYPNNEVPIAKTGRGRPYFLDSYDPIKGEIVFRRETQFSEVQFKAAKDYFREFVTKYPPGSVIADVPSAKGLAGRLLEGKMIFEVPVQWKAIPKAVLDEASRLEIMIRDINGKIYNPH